MDSRGTESCLIHLRDGNEYHEAECSAPDTAWCQVLGGRDTLLGIALRQKRNENGGMGIPWTSLPRGYPLWRNS